MMTVDPLDHLGAHAEKLSGFPDGRPVPQEPRTGRMTEGVGSYALQPRIPARSPERLLNPRADGLAVELDGVALAVPVPAPHVGEEPAGELHGRLALVGFALAG